MAVLEISDDEQTGIKKEVDEGAYELLFKAVQEDIYSFPIRSFVRETISNGIDAITERKIAAKILNGEDPAKYYRQKNDGKLLKDSGFDKDYYKKEYLSEDSLVYVTYKELIGRDLISIKDCGVGLGGSRLKGYFKIGYSSKRNMKDVMGKFGSGSKSGLATGVKYFTMHTVYNGYKTSFMIYESDYDPITPDCPNSINEVWNVTFANGSTGTKTIYWQPTTEDNSVTIDLEVKKHNKETFLTSVTEQFQYFKDTVHLTQFDLLGSKTMSKVLNITPHYESEFIIIPQTSTYSAPHILVDGISYGLISWPELELQSREGRIALKGTATDLDITQARESLKWTDKTKATIKKLISNAEVEASNYITEALEVPELENVFDFNNKYSVMRKSSSDTASLVFSKFLDIHSIIPKYEFTVPIEYFGGTSENREITDYLGESLFKELFYKFSIKVVKVKNSDDKLSIASSYAKDFSDIANLPIVFSESSSLGPKRAEYILNTRFPEYESFVYIRPNATGKERSSATFFRGGEVPTHSIFKYMLEVVKKYCSFNLDTENWEEIEEEVTEKAQVIVADKQSKAKYRRLNKLVIYREYDISLNSNWRSDREFDFTRQTTEISIARISKDFGDDDIVLCTNKFLDLGKLLVTGKYMLRNHSTRIIFVSEESLKHYLPYGTFITEYFRKFNEKTNELMIGKLLRDMATLKEYNQLQSEHNYLLLDPHFTTDLLKVDAGKVADLHEAFKLNKATSLAKVLTGTHKINTEAVTTVMDFMTRLSEFQKILASGDDEIIVHKSQEFFGSDKVYTLNSYDEEFINSLKSELKRVSVCRPLIGSMSNPGISAIEQLNELINYKNSQDVSI